MYILLFLGFVFGIGLVRNELVYRATIKYLNEKCLCESPGYNARLQSQKGLYDYILLRFWLWPVEKHYFAECERRYKMITVFGTTEI